MDFLKFQVKFKNFLKRYFLKIVKIIFYPLEKFILYKENKDLKKTINGKQLKKIAKSTVNYYYKKKYKIYLKRPDGYMTSYFSHYCYGYDYDYVLNTTSDFIPYKLRNKYKLWRINKEQKVILDTLLVDEFKKLGFEVNEMKNDKEDIYYQVIPKFN